MKWIVERDSCGEDKEIIRNGEEKSVLENQTERNTTKYHRNEEKIYNYNWIKEEGKSDKTRKKRQNMETDKNQGRCI